MTAELVLVTGASGFIATHVVRLLQTQGYKVRGTVRSLKDTAKVKPLRELCPDALHPLELVEADLMHDESWVPAVEGCTYVIHMASPLPAEPVENEDDVIKPAVNGTLAVLKACGEGVKRVVVTSSTAAVTAGDDPRDCAFTEDDWSDIERAERSGPYYKSKLLAEKAAWEFVEKLPEEKRFELVVLNPCGVIGPVLCGGFAAIMGMVRRLLQREMPALPKIAMGLVDVRDVALAHVSAMTTPEAAGHRHVLAAKTMSLKEIGTVLDDEFSPQGYNVPLTELPNFLFKFASFFICSLRHINPRLGVTPIYSNTRMTSVLGVAPRDVKNSLTDMAYTMIELGHITKTEQYTGPKFSELEI